MRPQHLTQLLNILQKELDSEEFADVNVDLGTTADVAKFVESIVQKFQDGSQRGDSILLGLQKAALIGDIALQHHPDTTALVWAGVRFILQVMFV